ncbi:hypothetical protein RQP54_17855 [Curvibacter sp. APW13]|uniref:hypothetical protein n=1 Tax=Curvibacter sp. APW13 TaxID=3077236 RepID=UPI0028DDEAC7|nr:hypothetical protein [Curvibacter sp. APW13]MDT8992742.1 hypothetical protein [Curvibacter sp. APW13]
MSFMDANKGTPSLKLRLSRRGVALGSAALAASIVALLALWSIEATSSENESLRATIRTMSQKAEADKNNDPRELQIAELSAKVQALEHNALRVRKAGEELVQSAAAMPEFKSPQYREPYQALLKQINELNAVVQTPLSEVAK